MLRFLLWGCIGMDVGLPCSSLGEAWTIALLDAGMHRMETVINRGHSKYVIKGCLLK